jgi:predicted phosphoribosyltransferase
MDGSRTDTIIECVRRELKRRKEEIEKDRSFKSLTVKIIISDRDGLPHSVLYQKECKYFV